MKTQHIILIYYCLLLVIGIPGWWLTTAVSRAHLPENELQQRCAQTLPPSNVKSVQVHPFPEYILSFAMVLADPVHDISWDHRIIEGSFRELLRPFSTAVNFTVQSQVIHFASIETVPYNEESQCFVIPTARAYNILSPQQWYRGETSNTIPTIKFAVLVPPVTLRPLCIRNEKGHMDGFIVPRWGGIVVWNAPENATEMPADELHHSLQIFAGQLAKMLDIPVGELQDPSRHAAFTSRMSQSLIHNAMRKTCSLAKVIAGLPDVVVSEEVAQGMTDTLALTEKAQAALDNNRLSEAAALSKQAAAVADALFFDPSVVAQLYFPTEHLYAVYLPLLLPICVPVFVNMVKEIRLAKQKRRQRT